MSVFYDRLLARYLAMQTNRLRGMQVGSFSALFHSSNLGKKKTKTEIQLGQVGKGQIPPLHVVEDLMVALTHTDDGIVPYLSPSMSMSH